MTGTSGAPTIAGLPRPFFIAHRGGAGIAPENSMEAYLQALALGADAIEAGDLQLLADGALGAMHDATVDRTTTGSGAPSAYATAGWKQLVLDSSSWFGSGWPDLGAPPTFDEIVSRLGGRTVLVPEVKDRSPATAVAVCAALEAAGLVESALVQCFDFDTCRVIAATGCHTVHLMTTGLEHTPAAIRAAGIEWVALPTTAAPTIVHALKGAGLGVLVFTDDDQKQVAGWWATGDVDGFFTDQPAYAAGASTGYAYRTDTAPWVAEGRRSHGLNDAFTTAYAPLRAAVVGPAGDHRFQPAPDHRSAILQGWACPLEYPDRVSITVPITFDGLDTDPSSWAGCYFGLADDTTAAYDADVTGPAGWLARVDQTGETVLLRSDGSTFTRCRAVPGPPPLTGDTVRLVITVTPTDITVARAGAPAITVSDGSPRGAYFHLRNRTKAGVGRYSWGAVAVSSPVTPPPPAPATS